MTSRTFRRPGAMLSWLLVITAPASVLPAQVPADRDVKEVAAYVLKEEAYTKFAKATKNLAAAGKELPGSCAEEEGARSIDQQAARMDAVPQVKSAIQSAGMTTREFLVFSWSLFQAGMASWALEQPGGKLPPGASMDNVKLYRAHKEAIEKMKPILQPDCDEDDEDRD